MLPTTSCLNFGENIGSWLHNNSGKGQAKVVAPFLSFRAFNGLSAYKHDDAIKDKINKATRKKTSPKEPDWLPTYNRIASEMYEKLEEEEKEEWEEIADEWNATGPPPDAQAQ